MSETKVVIPGDVLDEETLSGSELIVLGPGLIRGEASRVQVTRPGLLRQRIHGEQHVIHWVDTHAKRYVAAKNENVVGVVLAKQGDSFR